MFSRTTPPKTQIRQKTSVRSARRSAPAGPVVVVRELHSERRTDGDATPSELIQLPGQTQRRRSFVTSTLGSKIRTPSAWVTRMLTDEARLDTVSRYAEPPNQRFAPPARSTNFRIPDFRRRRDDQGAGRFFHHGEPGVRGWASRLGTAARSHLRERLLSGKIAGHPGSV